MSADAGVGVGVGAVAPLSDHSASALAPPSEHARSTSALRALLAHAADLGTRHARFRRRVAIGPLDAEVFANDPAAGEALTRCLLPGRGDDAPALELHLMTGDSPPGEAPPPWNLPHSDARHLERLHLSPDGELSAFYDHDRHFWLLLDRPARRAVFWLERASDLPFWEAAAPFKTLIHWFLAPTPVAMLHGGLVCHGGRAMLLAGPGGSGKSTTVAACFEAGLGVGGDDLVLAERTADGWRAHALYDAVKLIEGDGPRVPPLLAAAPWVPCGEKRLTRYSDACPARLVPVAALAGLVQCVIADVPQPRLVPIGGASMLRALGLPTVFLLRGHEATTLAKISRLVRELPCFRLELAPDPALAACLLRRHLEGIEA